MKSLSAEQTPVLPSCCSSAIVRLHFMHRYGCNSAISSRPHFQMCLPLLRFRRSSLSLNSGRCLVLPRGCCIRGMLLSCHSNTPIFLYRNFTPELFTLHRPACLVKCDTMNGYKPYLTPHWVKKVDGEVPHNLCPRCM
jgi:hypothetical protein